MAVASSSTPIKIIMGSTYGAGFDITAKTPIDGRMSVQTLADLTNKDVWASKSGTAAKPEYWLYNGMPTTVADTGRLYVLTGIDESLDRTIWPNPAAPGTTGSGPRWVEAGGVDNFLKDARIIDAKYGYISAEQAEAAYYEKGDPNYDRVMADKTMTTPAEEKKYLKLVVEQGDQTGTVTHIVYCDIQDLIKNDGRILKLYGDDSLCIEFDGTIDKEVHFTGTENLAITVASNLSINYGLVWLDLPADPHVTVYIDGVETVVDSEELWGDIAGTSVYSQNTYDPYQGETRDIYDISGTHPSEGQSVYTECLPIHGPSVIRYWYGHTGEGDRNPDDNSFVSANQTTSTSSTSYIMPHTVEVDSAHQYQVVSDVGGSGQYGRGYIFSNNTTVTVHLADPSPVPETWELWFTVQSGSSNTRNIEVRDSSSTLIGTYPAPVKGSTPLQIHLTGLSSGDYTFRNVGGGTAIIGLIVAKTE